MRASWILGLAVLAPAAAHADVWSREDASTGIVSFTNIRPGSSKGWKRLTAGPGKAGTISGTVGSCKSNGGRAVVPARDRDPARYQRYDVHIRDAAVVYQVPEALIRAVMKVESDFDPRVVSCAGAEGLMQLMPGTQKVVGVEDPWDARQAVFGGSAYLRRMANLFAGDLTKTIAAYHAGPGAVQKYDGVPPYETTRLYVHMVRRTYERNRGAGARLAASAPAPTGTASPAAAAPAPAVGGPPGTPAAATP